MIEKAGEIIPQVIKVVLDRRPRKTEPFVMPQRCPVCDSEVLQQPGDGTIYLEPLVQKARHIEVQIAADRHDGLAIRCTHGLVHHRQVEIVVDRVVDLTPSGRGAARLGAQQAFDFILGFIGDRIDPRLPDPADLQRGFVTAEGNVLDHAVGVDDETQIVGLRDQRG